MSEDATDTANAATIKAAAVLQSRSQGPSNAELRKLEQASAMLAGTVGEPAGMTAAELEEEALLLLVRQQNALRQEQPADDKPEASKRMRGHDQGKVVDYSDLLRQFEILPSSDGDSDEDEDDQAGDAEETEQAAVQQQRQAHRPAMLQRALGTWERALSETLLSIRDAHNRCQQPIGEEISILVRLPAEGEPASDTDMDAQLRSYELVFVKWVNPAEREGRTTRVDNKNRVVWSPASLFGKVVPSEVFDLARFNYVVNTAGATSKRIRGGRGELRDTLPPEVVRFVNFMKVAIMYANEDSVKVCDSVIACACAWIVDNMF